jgi:hypothetical protein
MGKYLLETFTNRLFDPFEVTLGDIDIRDIAHALSMLCRYCGHTRSFYSVAEHSLLVSRLAEHAATVDEQHDPRSDSVRIAAKWGLLHDASEAYLGEVCRGLKHRPGTMEVYREAEESLSWKIWQRFMAPRDAVEQHFLEKRIVKPIDRAVCGTEMRQLMHRALDTDGNPLPRSIPGVVVGVMGPAVAETNFLARFVELWGDDWKPAS